MFEDGTNFLYAGLFVQFIYLLESMCCNFTGFGDCSVNFMKPVFVYHCLTISLFLRLSLSVIEMP